MPIYEYRCEKCGHELEAIQKLSEAALVTCPVCEEDSLKKRISAAGFRLKGAGWYETDFKSGKKRNISGDDGGGSSSSTTGSDSSSDSKSATNSDSSSSSKSDSSSGGAKSPKADSS
jgi:putative FmdB family regulatory protein